MLSAQPGAPTVLHKGACPKRDLSVRPGSTGVGAGDLQAEKKILTPKGKQLLSFKLILSFIFSAYFINEETEASGHWRTLPRHGGGGVRDQNQKRISEWLNRTYLISSQITTGNIIVLLEEF